jgi:hypothetical protein
MKEIIIENGLKILFIIYYLKNVTDDNDPSVIHPDFLLPCPIAHPSGDDHL